MHFHYPSFLLGLLFGFVLIFLLIYLIYLSSARDDERVFRRQKLFDDYGEEDHSLK